MKIIRLLTVFSASLFLWSCETKKGTSTEANDSTAQKYECPMHPDVIGKQSDTCPKCGMKLTKVHEEKASSQYKMEFKAVPAVEAGKSALLSFTPTLIGHEQDSVPLDIQHDKKIHLIVVSRDLAYFDHIHPQRQANGSYEIRVLTKGEKYSKAKFQNEAHFDKGGDYVLFADYLPTGASHQLERIDLNVAGPANPSQQFTKEKLVATTDDYEVTLQPKDAKLLTGELMHIAAIIKKSGKEIPADQFENYLSAKAHVVVISEDTKNYLHVHPDVSNGRLDLHTTFEKPGIYRGWLQFQTNGEVHTADFVLNVAQGTTDKAAEPEHHH
jgi:hypothetical protein